MISSLVSSSNTIIRFWLSQTVFSFLFLFLFKLWSLRCLLLWCAGEKCKWILLCNLVKIIEKWISTQELLVGGIFKQWRHWPSSNSRGSKVWRMFFFYYFLSVFVVAISLLRNVFSRRNQFRVEWLGRDVIC